MYAVLRSGGKQYKVEEGQVFRIEKLDGAVGDEVVFDDVLMVGDDDHTSIGQPVLPNAAVHCRIAEQGRAKKIIVFTYKRRKRHRRKQGHRQYFTAVRVDKIALA